MTARRTLCAGVMVCMTMGAEPVAAQPAVGMPPQPSKTAPLERVAVGGQDLIALDQTPTRIALGDATVVDVKLIDRQIRLLGLKAGSTDLTIWSKADPAGRSFSIVVGPSVAALQTHLAAVPALQNVGAVSTPQGITLEGGVPSLQAGLEADAIARNESGAIANNMAVSGRRMVAVEIRFASISTSTLKALGLNFQKLGSGFEFASGVPGSISGFAFTPGTGLAVNSGLPVAQAFNLLLSGPGADYMGAISVLGQVNLARVLAEPTLMVRSGDDAHFLAGGEIPIPVAQSGQANGAIGIQYRKFGVQLQVHATVMSDDRIVLNVNPEVSELDFQNALTLNGFNVPAIASRSTDTTIELGDGQSFVLAGLMYSTGNSIEQKVPGLGDLPIVGDFFKHSQNSSEEQELIIVATPHLVSPMAPGALPKLPGEGVAYAPSMTDMMLNTQQLDRFVAQYGLAQ